MTCAASVHMQKSRKNGEVYSFAALFGYTWFMFTQKSRKKDVISFYILNLVESRRPMHLFIL